MCRKTVLLTVEEFNGQSSMAGPMPYGTGPQ